MGELITLELAGVGRITVGQKVLAKVGGITWRKARVDSIRESAYGGVAIYVVVKGGRTSVPPPWIRLRPR